MKRIFPGLFVLVIILVDLSLHAQETAKCQVENTSFIPGESYSYILSYNWFVVFAEVGVVNFTLEKDRINNQNAYHFVGEGRTFNWWDTFFKVRDKYECWVRQDNLRPMLFKRNTREGSWRQQESYTFQGDSLIYRTSKVKEDPIRYDTIPINSCTWDVMSAILYTRNFDYSGYTTNDKIPVAVALDERVYDLYFRYQGVEDIKVKGFGTFECLKFSVMLVEGSMFHEGENMVLWVTNDKNQIPVYMESPILIGNIKARLVSIKGNPFPLDSKKR